LKEIIDALIKEKERGHTLTSGKENQKGHNPTEGTEIKA